MSNFDWRRLFRSEKGKLKPTMMEDVEPPEDPAASLSEQLVKEQDLLSLRLMRGVIHSAYLSGAIREAIARQVALQVNSGS